MKPRSVDVNSIAHAFTASITPVRATLGYRIALVLVTLAMLVLPGIYLALIAASGWLVVWWTHAGLELFHGRGAGLIRIVLYLAPLAAGGILVLFMIKPLFARRGGQHRSTEIDRRTQPLLVAYVEALCRVMGAPIPTRIDVDVRVNASAAFRRGLISMLGNDLVLTIGLPLVATMSVRQLTAVLAHEFGHFSQGVGMRFSYLTVVINHWFGRVVYERDAWDEKLQEWSQESDFRIAIILWLARAGIWITRRILWILMQIGHLLSMLLSRQMEFDADQYAVRVTGHRSFIETMRLLPVLELAERGAHSDLGQAWSEGRLGDDLPALVQANFVQLPEKLRQEVVASAMESQAGMYASHPATGLRITRAETTPQQGVIGLDGSATALFSDFPGLCRATSLDFYRERIPELDSTRLQSTAALVADVKRIELQHQASQRVWGEGWGWARMLDPRGQTSSLEISNASAVDKSALRKRLLDAGITYATAREAAKVPVAALLNAASEQTRFRAASELTAAGQTIALHDFGVKNSHELLPAVARLNRTVEERSSGLLPLEQAARARLTALEAWLEVPDHGLTDCDAQTAATLRESLVTLASRQTEIRAMRLAFDELNALVQHLGEHREDERYIKAVLSRLEEVNKGLNLLRRLAAPYPFAHQKAATTIGMFLVPELPGRQDLNSSMRAGQGALERCFGLHNRCLGALALAIEAAETASGPVSRNPGATAIKPATPTT